VTAKPPASADLDGSTPAEGPIARARELREAGNLEGAARELRMASERGDVAAMKHLGDLLKDRGDIDGALASYRSAGANGDVLGMAATGRILRERGELKGALEAYEAAAEGGDILAGVNAGDLLDEMGDTAGALAAYRQASEGGDATATARLNVLLARAPVPTEQPPATNAQTGSVPEQPSGESQQTEPAQQVGFVSDVIDDLPAQEDLLGFRPLVRALHALVDDRQTVLPLAIAITAPWGAGKSSVMLQLKTALQGSAGQERGAKLGRRWSTVQFDAWKYERSERLWAALAKAIYQEPQEAMGHWEKVRFRLRLEQRRLGWWRFLGLTLWPSLVAAAAAVAAINVHLSKSETTVKWLSLVAAGVALATQYGTLIANPFKRAIERYARRPDYEAHLGFTAEADRDIGVLTQLLAPDEDHGLAVFVDDLDRCSSKHVVEVVEAMNQIFNSTTDHRCVFILGLDRDVVATNINVAYADTVAQLKSDGNPLGATFGREFLAKLVQLSVTIPAPQHDALRTLMERITHTDDGAGDRVARESEVRRAQAPIHTASGPSLIDVSEGTVAVADGLDHRAVEEAARRERAERIEDSPEVAKAELEALDYLPRNPRQVKRFHNAFRLQLYVANEDPRISFEFTADQLIALARWVALRLRWPDLGDAITRYPDLLVKLEALANGTTGDNMPMPERALEKPPATPEPEQGHAAKVEQPPAPQELLEKWAANPDLMLVLRDNKQARRVGVLDVTSFLCVA
jgi:tetratricopeptide (TPR) repeat protein